MAGVINKIRSKGALLLVIVGLAMGSFILTDVLSQIRNIITGGQEAYNQVGKVGDQDISIDYLNQRIKLAIYNQEQRNQGQPIDEFARNQITNQTWEEITDEIILNEEYSALGLQVPEAEYKVIMNQPDVLQMFGGSISNVQNAYKQAEQNQELRYQITQLENFLIKDRLRKKYNALVKSGIFVSTAEARKKYLEENEKRNFEYLAINYASIPDKDVTLTDDDFNQYYQEHIEEFKQTRKESVVRYVTLPLNPTRGDSLGALNFMTQAATDFKTSTNDSLFVIRNNRSAQQFDFGYRNISDLQPAIADKVAYAQKDSVIGPFLDGGTYKVLKVNDIKRNDTLPFFKLRHILVRQMGPGLEDSLKALAKAMDIKSRVNKENFAELAASESDDKSPDGEIGWYKQGRFGEDFDKAIKNAGVGQLLGPIKGNQGFHIVEILDKSNTSIRLATIGFDIDISSTAVDSIRKIADLFLADVSDSSSFNRKCAQLKLQLSESPPLGPGTGYFPGLQGQAVKEIIRWAINGETGDVTANSFSADNAIMIGYIKQKFDEGYKPLESIKPLIATKVKDQLKAKMILKKLEGKTGDLNTLKNAYGTGPFISNAEGITFASTSIPGVGNDPILIGTVFGLKQGEVSKPIVGSTGVYVVKVTSIQELKPDEKTIQDYRLNMIANRRQQFERLAFQGLKETANIKDFRYNFGL